MLSTTWNAKASDFESDLTILGRRTPDDMLLAFHITQQYVGMEQVASFSEHDVVRNADPESAMRRLRDHLDHHVILRKKSGLNLSV